MKILKFLWILTLVFSGSCLKKNTNNIQKYNELSTNIMVDTIIAFNPNTFDEEIYSLTKYYLPKKSLVSKTDTIIEGNNREVISYAIFGDSLKIVKIETIFWIHPDKR